MRALALTAALGLSLGCGAPDDAPLSWATTLATLEAKPADQETVLRKLASQDLVEVAWGAYLAGDLGVVAATDPLLGLLRDGPPLRGYALDALARLGARVADEELRALLESGVDRMTTMAVVLQEPAAHRGLIFDAARASFEALGDDDEVWEREHEHELATWRGYANALAYLHDRPFAAMLLASLRTSVAMEVVSPGDLFPAVGCHCGAWGRSVCGWSTSTPLPPHGVWSFASIDDADCVMVLLGPVDVCLARIERPGPAADSVDADAVDDDEPEETAEPEQATEPEPIVEIEADPAAREPCTNAEAEPDKVTALPSARNTELLRYLGALVDSDLPPFDGTLEVRHVWRDAAAYHGAVRNARERLEGQYRDLAAALRDSNALPEGLPTWTPYIDIGASDLRDCGVSGPLPR